MAWAKQFSYGDKNKNSLCESPQQPTATQRFGMTSFCQYNTTIFYTLELSSSMYCRLTSNKPNVKKSQENPTTVAIKIHLRELLLQYPRVPDSRCPLSQDAAETQGYSANDNFWLDTSPFSP